MKREIRTIPADELRVAKREDGTTVIRGYAARFNVLSEEMWGFREQIAPGAFRDAIARDDVRALFNHDANFVLGRTKAGTLTLREDEAGLFMEAVPPDTQAARDVVQLIQRGDVTGQSFSFSMDYEDDAAEAWEYEGEQVLRTIRRVSRVYDVGPVAFPAYPDTDVAVAARAWIPDEVRARVAELAARAAAPKAPEAEGRAVELERRRLAIRGR